MSSPAHWQQTLRQTALPLAVLLTGVVISAIFGAWLHAETRQNAQKDFDAATQRVADEVQRRYNASVATLLGARGLYAASASVDRTEFTAYATSRGAQYDLRGVSGLGYIERVNRGDQSHFIARQHTDGAPWYEIKELLPNAMDPLYVVKYLEPGGPLHPAIGLDMGSERGRREAIERAVVSGNITLSPPISVANETVIQQLLMLPLYTPGAHPPSSETEHTQRLRGLIYAQLQPSELLLGLPDVMAGTVNAHVLDTTDGVSILLFDSELTTAELEFSTPSLAQRDFESARVLKVGGRDLLLTVESTPAFESTITRMTPLLAAGAGCVLSLMLAALLRMQSRSLARAQQAARDMTQELNRLAEVVKHTSNAVSIADREGRIHWVNEGFTRVTGYSLQEAQGKTAGELLGSGKAEQEALDTIAKALAQGTPCRVEILNKAKSGDDFWVDAELQPLFSSMGELTGFMEIASDVTSRRATQERLEASLRENDALISAMDLHAIVSMADRNGQIVRVNDAFCDISGYTREELIGQNHRIVSAGLHSHAFWAEMWKVISCGLPWRGEVCNKAKDGTLYWVDTFIAPFIGNDGQVERYISIRVNITASKTAAQEIERQRQALDAIISATNVGTWSWDYASGQVSINPRCAQIVGYTLETLAPVTLKTFAGLVHPDDMAQVRGQLEIHLQGATPSFTHDMRMRHKDGHWVWVTTHGSVVARYPNGSVKTLAGTHTDITERHAIEEDARRNARLLRGAIDAIDEAFVLFDPQDCLVLCNDKYREIYPVCAPLLVPGVSFERIVRYGAEHGEYSDAIGREEEWVAERLAKHRAGESALIQRLENGRTLRIVERKLADGHTVGFRIDITDLMAAQDAAEEASRAKSQFLANMSHEIRTPMNAILGMLTLLTKTPLNDKQADYADKAHGAAKALLGLLNDILDISKVEAGKMTLDPQPFSVQQLLRDLSVILTANVGSKPVKLVWKVDPAVPPHLVGDVLRLQQILVNLGGNAVKFTTQGQVVVSLQLINRTAQAATVRFSVRDTGIGIAPENQAKIFSGFTQAEASTTRRFGGTGLGVSISHKLTALMGGELELHSVLGEGSEFFFQLTLPVSAARFVARSISRKHIWAAGSGQRLQGLRILLTEDNPNNQQVATELLQDEGAVITIASNGQEAVDAVRTQPHGFDVVLMDLQMPIMDGFAATQAIREKLGQAFLPIVAMTANAMSSDRDACLQAGMNDHVGKPFDLDQLVEVLRVHSGRESGSADNAAGTLPALRKTLPNSADAVAREVGVELAPALARMGNKVSIYTNMLRTFLTDVAGMGAELESLLHARDATTAQRLLHTIKGLAATLGVTQLSQQAATAEKQLKSRPQDPAAFTLELVQSVNLSIQQSQLGLQALLDALDGQAKAATPPAAINATQDRSLAHKTLKEMAIQLKASDMQALETLAKVETQWPTSKANALAPLQAAMAGLEFETALGECYKLLEFAEITI